MKIKFGISKKALRSRIVKRCRRNDGFFNFLSSRTKACMASGDDYRAAGKKWRKMTKAQKKKYETVQEDGSVRLDFLKYKNGQTEALALQ